jgi:hypothetical protein
MKTALKLARNRARAYGRAKEPSREAGGDMSVAASAVTCASEGYQRESAAVIPCRDGAL